MPKRRIDPPVDDDGCANGCVLMIVALWILAIIAGILVAADFVGNLSTK